MALSATGKRLAYFSLVLALMALVLGGCAAADEEPAPEGEAKVSVLEVKKGEGETAATAVPAPPVPARWTEIREALAAGDIDKANKALEELITQNPGSMLGWQMLALVRARQGEMQKALEAMDQANFEISPTAPEAHEERAFALIELGRGAEAMRLLETSLAMNPEDPLVLNTMALLMLADYRDLPRAQGMAQKATKLNPNQPAYWETLGRIQQARGRHVDAIISFHRVLQITPENEEVRGLVLESLRQVPPEAMEKMVGGSSRR